MKKISLIAGAAAIALIGGGGAIAHHSYQMFDTAKEVTQRGVLKSVEWTNPHIWVQVVVPNAKGKGSTEYGFEGGSPNGYARTGWRKNSLKIGDTVTVINNPLRDGSAGGNLIKLTFSSGAIMGRGATSPSGVPAPGGAAPAGPPVAGANPAR